MNRTLVAAALLTCVAAGACGQSTTGERTGGQAVDERDRADVGRAARQFGDLYLGPLTRAEASATDLRRLRQLTSDALYTELVAKHRYAAKRRRESEYARDKLDARTACRIGTVRVTARGRGRWVVVDERDARFTRDGRCVAASCR